MVIDEGGVIARRGARRRSIVAQAQPFASTRDTLWPKSVVTWLVLSVIFLLLSVQAVSPTRRWRPAPRHAGRRRGPAA